MLLETGQVVIDILQVFLYAAGGLGIGVVVSLLLTGLAVLLRRRRGGFTYLSSRLRTPQRIFLSVMGIGLGLMAGTRAQVVGGTWEWQEQLAHGVLIVGILAGANLLAGLLRAVEDSVNARSKRRADPGTALRIQTQLQLLTRVGIAVVWVAAFAVVLLTFDAFRAVGASLFASAGILSIIAGLAAQSSLGNLFAGLQLAFSDALRVGDTVVVEATSGKVEEITLSYVVVRVWDGRRLVIPSTTFTANSFENWTKTDPSQLGDVTFDLDWMVPVPAFRAEALRLVEGSDLWDGRTANAQVTDTQDRTVTLRILVSAANSDDLWNLRVMVREEMVRWLQTDAPYALPRTRIEPDTTAAPPEHERDELVERTQRALAEEIAQPDPEPEPEQDAEPAPARRARVWFRGWGQRHTTGKRRKMPTDEDEEPHLS